jgi:imidazolonepropionase
MGPTLIVRGARLATMDAPQGLAGDAPLGLIEDGALIADGAQIVWVGTAAGLPAALERLARTGHAQEEIVAPATIDAGGALVTPGLVEPHTHALFAGDRSGEHAQRLAGRSYLEIAAAGGGIRATVRATAAASDEELVLGLRERLARLVAGGVTTAEVKSGYGLSVDAELRLLRLVRAAARGAGCDVMPTLLGLHAIPEGSTRESWVRAVVEELTPEVARQGLARGCDAFCEQGAFTAAECEAALRAGADAGLVPHLHADQLSAGGGAQLAARLGCASADHLERTDDAGAAALAAADCTAVLLPLAAWFLREPKPAQAALFLAAGATVALGGNLNPGTQRLEGVSLLLAAGCLVAGLSPAQSLWAATRGGAQALRLGDRGRLAPGLRADLVLFAAPGADHLAAHAGVDHARVVIREGRVVLDRRSEPELRC